MLCFNNLIFVCNTGTVFGDLTTGTRFYFKEYGDIIRAKFGGENILYGELIGMVNQLGQLEAIFNYCTSNSHYYSDTCSLTPEMMDNKICKLHGLVLSGDERIESELVLEEQL